MLLVLRAISELRGSVETRNVGSTRPTAKECEAASCLDFSASMLCENAIDVDRTIYGTSGSISKCCVSAS